jgi:allantoin racemase
MSRSRILVVNPNSNTVVTAGLEDALRPLAFPQGPEIVCLTLAEGPVGIESQADVESVVQPLRKLVLAEQPAATIIACYSDPGLHACREVANGAVLGIAEAGVMTALARGDRFGVIAIREKSIRRHLRQIRSWGVLDRLAGERALEMSVAETASGAGTLARMVAVGRALRDEDGADVIVMGCAGMARHRTALQAELGIPVIDPTQAAVAMALGTVGFGG